MRGSVQITQRATIKAASSSLRWHPPRAAADEMSAKGQGAAVVANWLAATAVAH